MTDDKDVNDIDIIEVRGRSSVIGDLETLLDAPSYSGLFASACIYLIIDAFIFSLGFFGILGFINSLKGTEFLFWKLLGLAASCGAAYLGLKVWIGLIKIFRRAIAQGLSEGDKTEDAGRNRLTYFVSLFCIVLGGIVSYYILININVSFINEAFLVFFMLMGLNCLFAIILLMFPESKTLKELDRRLGSFFEKEFYIFSLAYAYLIISGLISFMKDGMK